MVSITCSPIDVPAVLASVTNSHADEVSVAVHTVRSHAHGRRVRDVEYTTDVAQAREVLTAIEHTIAKRWQVKSIALIHRVGIIHVGNAVFAAAISSTSWRDAFEATSYAIESMRSTIQCHTNNIMEEGLAWFVGQHDVDVCGIAV